jgi:TonB family protein
MKGLSVFAISFFALFVGSGLVLAQDPAPKVINGGVLNGKAVSLPKPAYSAEARDAKAEGAVAVDVIVDETGAVIGAEAQVQDQSVKKSEDGTWIEIREVHPALRAAAEEAARNARFSPTLLSGQPVQVKGRIVYNFVAGGGEMAPKGKNISGGVLNGKAASLPQPEYPAAALAVKAEGAVSVQVLIDEEGNVISASAVSGHPLLRAAAVAAAKEAKFAPTRLSGEPVKVSGVLTYNFVAQ